MGVGEHQCVHFCASGNVNHHRPIKENKETESFWGLALEPLEEEEEAQPAADTKNGL